MNTWTIAIAVAGLIAKILFDWVKTTPEQRAELFGIGAKTINYLRRFIIVAFFTAIIGFSALGIYLFESSEAPLGRQDVLLLLMHVINLGIYGYTAVDMIRKIGGLKRRQREANAASVPET